KYSDQQFAHLGEDSQGTIIFPEENIGSATMKGVELELQFRPVGSTLLGADIQYNDALYNSFVYHTPNTNSGATNGTGCATVGTPTQTYTVDCSGKRPPFAPLWTADANLQQTQTLPNGADLVGEAREHFQTDTLTGQEFLPAEVQHAYFTTDF